MNIIQILAVSIACVGAFQLDAQNQEANSFKVMSSADDTYTWGYRYPDQFHVESKHHTGELFGSYGYTNSEGNLVQVNYAADPIRGFNIVENSDPKTRTGIAEVEPQSIIFPGASFRPIEDTRITDRVVPQPLLKQTFVPVNPIEPAVFRPIKDTSITNRLVPQTIFKQTLVPVNPLELALFRPIKDTSITNRLVPRPLVKQSLEPVKPQEGILFRGLFTLKSNEEGINPVEQYPNHYLVNPEIIQKAGGVSALANAYGLAPIAAVHDVQVSRN